MLRLHVRALPRAEPETTLDPDRSHYLCRVRRCKNGDPLELFDGAGLVRRGELIDANKKAARVRLDDATQASPPDVELGVLLALIQGDAADRAVQRSVELGATSITLLRSERSNATHAEKRVNHLRRVAVSSCEQCGQNFVPTIEAVTSLESALTDVPQVICLHPGEVPLPADLPMIGTLVCIGPEGGWSERELATFEQLDAVKAGLGSLVLRAETAPAAALAVVQAAWGWRV